MIDSRAFTERLAEVVGGHPPFEIQQALEQHLAHCPACREHLEAYRLASHLAGEGYRPALPPHVKTILDRAWGD